VSRRLLVVIFAVSTAIALALAFVIATGEPQNIENNEQDNPRYFHCAELRRIQSRWFNAGPQSTMWEAIGERYERECPDHGLEVREDIQWSPDLPPEGPG
jgi:hypothetical protein